MALSDSLNNIIQAQTDIRTAINNKGGELTETQGLKDYASAIDNLPEGTKIDTLVSITNNTLNDANNENYTKLIVPDGPFELNNILMPLYGEYVDLSGLNMSQCTSIAYILGSECNNKIKNKWAIGTLDLHGWDLSNCTNCSVAFRQTDCIRNVNFSGWKNFKPVGKNMQNARYGVMYFNPKSNIDADCTGWDTSEIYDWSYSFWSYSGNLTIDWDMINTKWMLYCFYNTLSIRGNMYNLKISPPVLKQTIATKWDRETALVFINGLYDFAANGDEDSHVLSMNSTLLAKLTDEDIAIATSKGWTVA